MKKTLAIFSAAALLLAACDKIPADQYTTNTGGGGDNWQNANVHRVYVEKYTGPKCPNCPAADVTLNEAHHLYGDNLVVISVNHPVGQGIPFPGDQDLRTDDGTAWDNYYGINAIPTAFVNRDQSFINQLLSVIVVDPLMITLSIILFVASSVFYAGVCTFVGSLVSTARDASSFIGPAIIAMVLPLYFMQAFMATEPNVIVQFLTYCPFTAPIALMLRNGFGTLSIVEFCIGITIVVVSAIIAIYFAVKSFQKNAVNFEIVKPKFFKR